MSAAGDEPLEKFYWLESVDLPFLCRSVLQKLSVTKKIAERRNALFDPVGFKDCTVDLQF